MDLDCFGVPNTSVGQIPCWLPFGEKLETHLNINNTNINNESKEKGRNLYNYARRAAK